MLGTMASLLQITDLKVFCHCCHKSAVGSNGRFAEKSSLSETDSLSYDF